MHTRNINVKTAAQESTERWGDNPVMDLTYEQASDLFLWVVNASSSQLQPIFFRQPINAVELTFSYDEAPDYFSIWFIDGYPVAVGTPMDNYFRSNTSLIERLTCAGTIAQ